MPPFLRQWFDRPSRHRPPSPLDAYLHAYAHDLHVPGCLAVADLEAPHGAFGSSLHRGALNPDPDISAFLHAALRLPTCVTNIQRVLIGPCEEVFSAAGFPEVSSWIRVQSRARRRRYHFNGTDTLAVFATSLTDLDDLIPSLCAFQMEWNKMHRRLAASAWAAPLARGEIPASSVGDALRQALALNRADWDMLGQVWDQDWNPAFTALARKSLSLHIERLPLNDRYFEEAAGQWWDMVSQSFDMASDPDRPLYLVSSNTHAFANLVSGFAAAREPEIDAFLRAHDPEGIRALWDDSRHNPDLNHADLLYYTLRLFLEHHPDQIADRTNTEQAAGLARFLPAQYPHLEAQRIELNRLDSARLDPALMLPGCLTRSRAWILNLDYPLGLAAGHLLRQACARFPGLRGVFIVGKSAATIGRLGDILVPGQVFDSHTRTSYRFANRLDVRQLTPFLNRIAAFDDQKSVTVRGTFLHGHDTLAPLIHDDFTGIEMEAGPYLAALHRHFTGQPPPPDATLDLALPPDFSLGVLHYTSDTPYNIRPSLLSARLGLTGLEAAYASARAILQCILRLEAADL